jgi:hypothetical protein
LQQQQQQQQHVLFVKNKILWYFKLYTVDHAATMSAVM